MFDKRLDVLAVVSDLYSMGIAIFHFYMGGTALDLIITHYDTSVPNGSVRVNLESLPRDIYSDTEDTAILLLICAFFTMLALFYSIYHKCKNLWDDAFIGSFLALGAVSVAPLGLGLYLMWKSHSISDADRLVWDNVDTGFMDLIDTSPTLVGLTAPGCIVFIVSLVYILLTQ